MQCHCVRRRLLSLCEQQRFKETNYKLEFSLTLSFPWCLHHKQQSNWTKSPKTQLYSQLRKNFILRYISYQRRFVWVMIHCWLFLILYISYVHNKPGAVHSTSQLNISATSMILNFAHFSPWFCASANFSLGLILKSEQKNKQKLKTVSVGSLKHLVLFLLPVPHLPGG